MVSAETLRVRPSPLDVVTVWSRSEPSALRSVTVSVVLPSALWTVTSDVVRSKVPLPVRSLCTVFDRPVAESVVTVASRKLPSPLRSCWVVTTLPSALVAMVELVVRSTVPLPSRSIWTVLVRPSALVCVTVRSTSEPSALRSLTVSVRLRSVLTTITSVSVRSNTPEPVESVWTVLDRPSALVVVTARSSTAPLAARSLTETVWLPSALVARTSSWPVMPLPSRSRAIVTVLPSALVVVTVRSVNMPTALKSDSVSVRLRVGVDDGNVGLGLVEHAAAGVVELDAPGESVGADGADGLVGEAPVGVEFPDVDRGRAVGVVRRDGLGDIAIRVGGKGHVGRRAGGAIGFGVGGLARDLRAVRQRLGVVVSGQVDRGDAELAQGLEAGGAVGVGHQHAERAPLRVAGVELAVVVGVEHRLQRLHVGRRRGIPQREIILRRRGDGAGAGGIEHQYAVADAGPGGAVLHAAAARVDERIGRRKLGDVDAVAGEIEHHGGKWIGRGEVQVGSQKGLQVRIAQFGRQDGAQLQIARRRIERRIDTGGLRVERRGNLLSQRRRRQVQRHVGIDAKIAGAKTSSAKDASADTVASQAEIIPEIRATVDSRVGRIVPLQPGVRD